MNKKQENMLAAIITTLVVLVVMSSPLWAPLWWAYALPCLEQTNYSSQCWSVDHVIVVEENRTICLCRGKRD
jgi:hypothetical protein